jgi:hypothetical protein
LSPGYFGFHYTNAPTIQFFSQNWSNKGHSGTILIKGPNSTNFEIGSKHWENADLPWLNMQGTANASLLQMAGEKYQEAGVDKEKGQLVILSTDDNKAAIIPTHFALHKPDWSFYGRLFTANNAGNLELYGNASGVVLKKDNGKQGAKLETLENQNGFSGRLILSGPNNENIFLGTKDWETSGLPLITLKGSDNTDKISLIVFADDPNTAENDERGMLDLHDSNGNGMLYGPNGVWSGTGPFNMWSGARITGTLELNGNFTGSGTQTYSSDQRLKKDIQPLGENILGQIESLEGVSYYWRKDDFPKKNFSDDQQIGLIAQQLEAQFPALVKTNDDGFKAVNYNGFTAVLLQAVKELNAKVEKLESENQKLQAEISASASNRNEIDQLKSQMEMLTKLVLEKSSVSTELSSTETAKTTGSK